GLKVEFAVAHDVIWNLRALIGLFLGKELGVNQQAVFEIINSKRGGFAETDGAQVSGDLGATRVRGFYGGRQLFARYEIVDLEIVDALIEPIIDGADRVFRAAQLVQLERECPFAFYVRAGDVYFGAG